jgi:CRP-like cAMP-binding protein
MVFKWLGGWNRDTAEDVHQLVAKKHYDRAVELLRGQLQQRPLDRRLRLQLGEVLVLARRPEEAGDLLKRLADELLTAGFAAQALAVLRKIQVFQPERADVREAIARLSGVRPPSLVEAPPTAAVVEAPRQDAPPPVATEEEEAPVDIVVEVEEPVPGPARSLVTGTEDPMAPILLASLPEAERQRLLDRLPIHVFGPGEIVHSEGEPGESVYILLKGRLRAYVKDKSSRNVALREIGAGDFFGELARPNGCKHAMTITAVEHCEIAELGPSALDALLAAHASVREVFEHVYEERSHSPQEMQLRGRNVRRVHLRKPPARPRARRGSAQRLTGRSGTPSAASSS